MKTALYVIVMALFVEMHLADLPQIRTAYQLASSDESTAKKLLQQLEVHPSMSPTFLGYKGAVTMMMAKFQLNPLNKLDYFNNGKSMLEAAIRKDEDNLELIFIRFSVQSNTPAFLNYNQNLNRDKYFLLANVKEEKDKDLKNRIIQFLKSSSYLSHAERNSLY